jgi:PAS domain-containing protein
MKSLPVPARLYIATITAVGALVLVALFAPPPPGRLPEFVSIVLARIVTSTFKLRLPVPKSQATMSVSFVFDFIALLLFGIEPSLVVAAVGAFSQSMFRTIDRNPPYRVAFNTACLVITLETTGLVYRALGGTVGALVSLRSTTALAAALVVYFMVNGVCLSWAVALSTNQRVRQVWQYNVLWGAPTYFIGGNLAALTAVAINDRAWGFMPMAAIQLYMTYLACKVYVGRLQDEQRHRDVVASLHEGMCVLGRDRRVVLWNAALERMTGISPRHAIGRQLERILPTVTGTALPDAIDRVLESGRDKTLNDFPLRLDTGVRILTVRIVRL